MRGLRFHDHFMDRLYPHEMTKFRVWRISDQISPLSESEAIIRIPVSPSEFLVKSADILEQFHPGHHPQSHDSAVIADHII